MSILISFAPIIQINWRIKQIMECECEKQKNTHTNGHRDNGGFFSVVIFQNIVKSWRIFLLRCVIVLFLFFHSWESDNNKHFWNLSNMRHIDGNIVEIIPYVGPTNVAIMYV